MAFLAYFSALGVMAGMVLAVFMVVDPKPIAVSSKQLASASSVKTMRVLRAESKLKKQAEQVAKKAAEPADETVRELAFTPSAGEDELEQALASADDAVPLPVPAPPRPVEAAGTATAPDNVATADIPAVAETEQPAPVVTEKPKPRRANAVSAARTIDQRKLRYVGTQDGIPTYVVVQ